MAKTVKASEVEKGQKVRVDSDDGMVEGEVTRTREAERRGEPIIWVYVKTGENESLHTYHAPDDDIELAG